MSALSRIILRCYLAATLLCISPISLANETIPTFIPELLKPWVSWVSKDQQFLNCPFKNKMSYGDRSTHICAWPSKLELVIDKRGGSFSQNWQILQDSIIPLPGSAKNWPQNVIINDKRVPVFTHHGRPSVELTKGNHKINGQFKWSTIPRSILVSAEIALVEVVIEGKKLPFPKIENNELWFQQSNLNETKQDAVDISIARKLTDGPFIRLDTIITVKVSGKMRESILGEVLPENVDLIGIKSDIPAFLDAQGLLHAKLKPGEWKIVVSGYAKPTKLDWQRPVVSHVWPKDEIWVFKGQDNLRLGKLTGANMTDTSQADMPDSWYLLPGYYVAEQDTLSYEIQHRGIPLHLENQLALERTLWLSFDQSTFTFSDRITGNMINDWRLSMQSPFSLESAEDPDGSVLITSLENNERGIENRYTNVNIGARGTLDAKSTLPITGWQHDFESVSVLLNLPPGTKLLAAFGADTVSNSWWGAWSIWASFIVLLATIASTRLISITAGFLTALMLVVIYHESLAPIMAILNLLFVITIKKHQPFEKLKTIVNLYWTASIVLAVGSILLFSALQLRTVIHPQLELKDYQVHNTAPKTMKSENLRGLSINRSIEYDTETITVTGSRAVKQAVIERYQSDAIIQAGTGIPDWQWKRAYINWQSPVASEQNFDLIVLSKTSYRIIKVIGIVLTLLWLFFVLNDEVKLAMSRFKTQSVATILALLLLTPLQSGDLQAQETLTETLPTQSLLDTLRKRLAEPPTCAPNCASVNSLTVTIKDNSLTLFFEIHANQASAISLPKSEFWRPQSASVNGKPIGGMVRDSGWVYLPVEQGVNLIRVDGQIAPVDTFQLQFQDNPRFIHPIQSDSWDTVGNQSNVLNGNSLTFIAKRIPIDSLSGSELTNEPESSRIQLNPMVKVERRLSFEQNWRVHTYVTRIAPATGSITIKIPILATEQITSADVQITNDMVEVTLPAGQNTYSWRSVIERQSELTLTAVSNKSIFENWKITSSPSWHVQLEGLPIILENQNNADYFVYSFYPQQNEALTIKVDRPNAVKGDILAIDRVDMRVNQGNRTSTLTLEFDYRSTQGGEHTILLPVNFQLKEIRANDSILNLQPEKGELTFPILPGKHKIKIDMRSNDEASFSLTSPKIDLQAPSSNITTTIEVSNQRWVLWASGPVVGPAVLYWGELLAFIVIALLLARIKFSPLSTFSWIVFGLGLSLSNWGILVLVALWFASLSASRFRPTEMNQNTFNFSQLILYGLSIIAVLSLISVVPYSLLSSPSMGIEGNNSYGNHLVWFADMAVDELPNVSVISISTLFYKVAMLIWVIWLSFSFISWIKWAWRALGAQGYWRNEATEK